MQNQMETQIKDQKKAQMEVQMKDQKKAQMADQSERERYLLQNLAEQLFAAELLTADEKIRIQRLIREKA